MLRMKLTHIKSTEISPGVYEHLVLVLVTQGRGKGKGSTVLKGVPVKFFADTILQGSGKTNSDGQCPFTVHSSIPVVSVTAQALKSTGETVAYTTKCAAEVIPDPRAVKLDMEVTQERFDDVGRTIVRFFTYRKDNIACEAKLTLGWENGTKTHEKTKANGELERVYERTRSEKLRVQITGYNTTDEENEVTLVGPRKGRGVAPPMNFQEIGTPKIGTRHTSSASEHWRAGYAGRKPMPRNYRSTSLFIGFFCALIGLIIEPAWTGTFYTPVLAMIGATVMFVLRTNHSERVRKMNLGYALGWLWNTNNDKWRLSFIICLLLIGLSITWNLIGVPAVEPGKTVPWTIEQQKDWNLRKYLMPVPDAMLPANKEVRPPKQIAPRSSRKPLLAPYVFYLAIVSFIFTFFYLFYSRRDELFEMAASIGSSKKGTLTSVAENAARTEVATADGRVHTFRDLVTAELLAEAIKSIPRWLKKR
ncbi:MAG: Ig-like domain-containing protein [Patescibacteria group bacterium]